MEDRINRIDLKRNIASHRQEYLEAFERVLDDAAFSGGAYADRFEEEFARYCGVKACSGVNNGTSALHCAMLALGIGPAPRTPGSLIRTGLRRLLRNGQRLFLASICTGSLLNLEG